MELFVYRNRLSERKIFRERDVYYKYGTNSSSGIKRVIKSL